MLPNVGTGYTDKSYAKIYQVVNLILHISHAKYNLKFLIKHFLWGEKRFNHGKRGISREPPNSIIPPHSQRELFA